MNKYKCPVCSSDMAVGPSAKGPSDGVYIWCSSDKCPAQEVFGHGDKEKDAWERIQLKYVRKENRQ